MDEHELDQAMREYTYTQIAGIAASGAIEHAGDLWMLFTAAQRHRNALYDPEWVAFLAEWAARDYRKAIEGRSLA